jgi:hypothetical protein
MDAQKNTDFSVFFIPSFSFLFSDPPAAASASSYYLPPLFQWLAIFLLIGAGSIIFVLLIPTVKEGRRGSIESLSCQRDSIACKKFVTTCQW